MGLSRYLPYAVLCVYYAWCATVLFTADLLLFVPRYFLVERHDTRSRWLGWRGEAQLQPLLPTAFQYARANAEDGADSEGGTPSISSNTTTTTSSSSSNSSSSRRHRGGSGSANMSVTCCVLAREGVARIRSLRSSMQPWWGQPQQTAVVRPTRTSSTATSSSSSPDVSDTSYTLRDTDDSGEDAEEEGGTVSLKDSPLGVVGIARSNAVSSDTAEDDDQEGIDGAGDASEDTQEASGSSRNSRQKRRAAMTKQCHAAQEAGAPVTDALFHGVDVRADLKGGNGDVQNEEVEEGEGESAMRAAVPAWCMVVFRRHDNNTISRIKASQTRASRDEDEEPPASRIAGQYGFLPPWYAAHARAQLLLAHVDPIFRMLAEVMCLRGWAASSPQTGKDTAKPSSSVEHARSFSRDSASFRCTAPVLLVVACRRFLSGLYVCCQVMAHTLVRVLFAIVQGSFPSLSPLGKTSGTAKVAAAAATATLAGLAGGPFHRLQRALRTRVARHVADTHHTFDVFAVTAATVPTNDGWPFTSSSTAAVHDDSSGGDAAQATAEKGDSVKTPLGASGHHPQRQPPSRRVSAARPVTSCRRSLGVYWLHGRQPNPTEAPRGTSSAAPAPPLVILLLCPSLLQGNGLYPFAVARISRICQLLTLAGEWRQAAGNASSRGEKEEENGAAAAAAFASAAPAQWHAAVPVVELATYTNASGVVDAISRPSLTLKDLRLVVHRLRSLEQQPSSSSQKSSTDPPASTSAARRVVIVAVGWSEAASLLLELAMTQQQPQQNTAAAAAASPSSQSRQDAEDSAHLDGLISLSHTLSSTFQLLPQQCDTSLAVMQPLQRSSGLAVSSPSMTTLAQRRRSEVAAHDNGYVEKSSERHENSLMGLSFASLLPSPHIPRVLSRLTTGPARLLLLLTRQQMIADNLIAQRHRQEEEGEETAKEKDGGGGGGAPAAAAAVQPFYVVSQSFRDAHEQAYTMQRGLDTPTLLWRHLQQQQQRKGQRDRSSGSLHLSTNPDSCASTSSGSHKTDGSETLTVATVATPSQLSSSSSPPMQATVEPSPLPPVVGGAVAAAASTTALTQHGLRALPTSTTTIGSAAASTADTADGTVASLIVVPTVGAGGRGEEGSNSNSSRRRSRGFSALLARFAPQQHPPPQRHSFSPFHSLYTVPSPDTVNSSTPLPHLETVTDWEVLMRSDAMAELRERQRLDTANVTAADLPNPPSVGLPLGNKIRPSSQERDDLHSTSVSRSGYKGFSPYQKNSKDTARRANSSGNIVRDAATAAAAGLQSPARRTSHTPSPLLPLRLPPVSLGRSIQSHMCIDDVVASCTLQSVAPLPWQSARYPDGDRSGSSHISAHNSLPPHSGDVSGRGAFRLPDGNNNNNGVSRTARLTVPGEMPPGARTRSVDYAAGTVDTQDSDGACLSVPPARPQLASTLTDVADVSFSSPYSLRRDSTSALWLPSHNSAPQVQLSVPGCHKDVPRIAGGKGEGDAATDHVRAGRHQLHSVTGAKRNVVDASSPFTTVVTPAINPDTADPANEATIDGDEHVFPPQQQQREERALSFSPSLHHGVNMATTTTGTGTTASPFFSPPPPAQLPIPHLPRPLPVRACNSQAAALVELRVRSAQHAALIQRIRIPTLLLHARDDPVAPPSTLPFSLLQANPWISTVLTRRGSHGVFMESASDVWRRPFLVLREEAAQTRGHREGRGKQRANDTSTANAATTAATTHRCDINDSSRKSDGADKDDCCSIWGGDGGEASPLPSLEKERAAHATQWRLRIAGTTWVERLLFEYVEQVVVAPATARSTMINTSTN